MNSRADNFCRMILVETPMFVVQFFDFNFPSGVQEFRSSGVEKIAFKIVNNPACTTRVRQDFFYFYNHLSRTCTQ